MARGPRRGSRTVRQRVLRFVHGERFLANTVLVDCNFESASVDHWVDDSSGIDLYERHDHRHGPDWWGSYAGMRNDRLDARLDRRGLDVRRHVAWTPNNLNGERSDVGSKPRRGIHALCHAEGDGHRDRNGRGAVRRGPGGVQSHSLHSGSGEATDLAGDRRSLIAPSKKDAGRQPLAGPLFRRSGAPVG